MDFVYEVVRKERIIMAKFNIEVELDWMNEEAYSIDDELRQRIVDGVENALLEKATTEAIQKVDKAIADKILEAEETIQDTVDKFVKNVSEEKDCRDYDSCKRRWLEQ